MQISRIAERINFVEHHFVSEERGSVSLQVAGLNPDIACRVLTGKKEKQRG